MKGNIDEVRERLEEVAAVCERDQWQRAASDIRALLADHARLLEKNAELTAAVRGLLDALPSATTHPAIAAARKAVQS